MVKVALLIGVSEFADAALAPLPAALRDINAVQIALDDPEMGGFDEVRLLENPDRPQMEDAIDALFRDRQRDDLVLLYFSGHGIKDDTGKFSLATRITEKHRLRTTAVAASFVHDVMSSSKSRRQVVILDCCFSGAFAQGMTAKDDASVDVKAQLGGEGRAVLTASTATQYAFAQANEELSVYTRFLVEGIRTGAADVDTDGHITVDELHEYAQRKVQEAAPAMKPEIYAVKEGYTIQLTKAPLGDPKLKYRKEVERFASRGDVSLVGRRTLDVLQRQLNLSTKEAEAIESEVLRPYREYEQKLENYGQVFSEALQQPFGDRTREELQRFQQVLGLRDEDTERVEKQLAELKQPTHTKSKAPASQPSKRGTVQRTVDRPSQNEKRKPLLWVGASLLGSTILVGTWAFRDQGLPKTPQTSMSKSASSAVNTPEDLKRASTSVVATLATEKLNQGNVEAAQPAIETLLDRGELNQAASVMASVPIRQVNDPTLNFLYGRLAWQSIKAGSKDYSLDDARRYWETAVKQQTSLESPYLQSISMKAGSKNYSLDDDTRRYWETAVKQQTSLEYENALSFAYYTQGKPGPYDLRRFQGQKLSQIYQAMSNILSVMQNKEPMDAILSTKLSVMQNKEPMDAILSTKNPSLSRQSLTNLAVLALVEAKAAANQPRSKQASLQNQVIKLRQQVLAADPVSFEPEALNKNWLWTEKTIKDWEAILALKQVNAVEQNPLNSIRSIKGG